MALSVGRIGDSSMVSYVQTKSNAYSVANQSGVSSSFTESALQANATGSVMPAHPVQYTNAGRQTVSQAEKIQENQKVSSAFNDIASGFAGKTTSYGSDSLGGNYSIVGSMIDVFA